MCPQAVDIDSPGGPRGPRADMCGVAGFKEHETGFAWQLPCGPASPLPGRLSPVYATSVPGPSPTWPRFIIQAQAKSSPLVFFPAKLKLCDWEVVLEPYHMLLALADIFTIQGESSAYLALDLSLEDIKRSEAPACCHAPEATIRPS